MKSQDVRCKLCGGTPKLCGSDHTDTCGPFGVVCAKCGEGSDIWWAYPREAWSAWKRIHKPSDIQLKAERIDKANRFIAAVAGCGRRFFHHDGRVSYFKADDRGRIWFVDKYTQRPIYTHYTGRWRGFTEGGTLKRLVEKLRDFIRTGNKQRLDLGPWPDWICGGDLWGYGAYMSAVRQAARKIGVTD